MSSLKDFRELLILSYNSNFVSDEEFVVLNSAFQSKNPDFSYDSYPSFDLDDVNEAECKAEFRVGKRDLPMHATEMSVLPLSIQRHDPAVRQEASLHDQPHHESGHGLHFLDSWPPHNWVESRHLQSSSSKIMQMPFQEKVQLLTTALDFSMELSNQFPGQEKTRGCYITGIRGFMPSSYNHWPYQMGSLETCTDFVDIIHHPKDMKMY